jgi:hypothetical protein
MTRFTGFRAPSGFVVASLLALAAAQPVAAFTRPAPGPHVSGNPAVIAGSKAGPLDVRGYDEWGTMGSLALPSGAWFITVKGYLQGMFTSDASCRVVAGSDSNSALMRLTQGTAGAGQWVSFELMTAHRFGSAGKAVVQCQTNAPTGNVLLRQLQMTALKASKLTTFEFGGPATTTGSGKPWIAAGRSSGSPDVPGDSSYHSIGEIVLPTGLWWITARANLNHFSLTPPDVFDCQLQSPTDFDHAYEIIGGIGASTPIATQVVHKFTSPGAVELSCASGTHLHASDVRITAVKAGHLVNREFGGGEFNYGSGTPQIISGFLDASSIIPGDGAAHTVGTLSLPAGSWAVSAKLTVGETTSGYYSFVSCRLVMGSDSDRTNVVVHDSEEHFATVELVRAHTFASGGNAKLVCVVDGTDSSIQASNVKVTAVQAASLTTKNI